MTGLSDAIEEREDGSLLISAAARRQRRRRTSKAVRTPHTAMFVAVPILRRQRAIRNGKATSRRQSAAANPLCLFLELTDGSRCRRCRARRLDTRGFQPECTQFGASPSCVATHPSDMCVALASSTATVVCARGGWANSTA